MSPHQQNVFRFAQSHPKSQNTAHYVRAVGGPKMGSEGSRGNSYSENAPKDTATTDTSYESHINGLSDPYKKVAL